MKITPGFVEYRDTRKDGSPAKSPWYRIGADELKELDPSGQGYGNAFLGSWGQYQKPEKGVPIEVIVKKSRDGKGLNIYPPGGNMDKFGPAAPQTDRFGDIEQRLTAVEATVAALKTFA